MVSEQGPTPYFKPFSTTYEHTIISFLGNETLFNLSAKQLKSHFLCENHFHPRHFLMRKLSKCAVPIKYEVATDITDLPISDNESGKHIYFHITKLYSK